MVRFSVRAPIVHLLTKKKGHEEKIVNWFVEFVTGDLNSLSNPLLVLNRFSGEILNEEMIKRFLYLYDSCCEKISLNIELDIQVVRVSEHFEYSPIVLKAGYDVLFTKQEYSFKKFVDLPLIVRDVGYCNAGVKVFVSSDDSSFNDIIDQFILRTKIEYYPSIGNNEYQLSTGYFIFDYVKRIQELLFNSNDLFFEKVIFYYSDVWGRKYEIEKGI